MFTVKLEDYEYKDNVINRIKESYNMGVRERFDIFLMRLTTS